MGAFSNTPDEKKYQELFGIISDELSHGGTVLKQDSQQKSYQTNFFIIYLDKRSYTIRITDKEKTEQEDIINTSIDKGSMAVFRTFFTIYDYKISPINTIPQTEPKENIIKKLNILATNLPKCKDLQKIH